MGRRSCSRRPSFVRGSVHTAFENSARQTGCRPQRLAIWSTWNDPTGSVTPYRSCNLSHRFSHWSYSRGLACPDGRSAHRPRPVRGDRPATTSVSRDHSAGKCAHHARGSVHGDVGYFMTSFRSVVPAAVNDRFVAHQALSTVGLWKENVHRLAEAVGPDLVVRDIATHCPAPLSMCQSPQVGTVPSDTASHRSSRSPTEPPGRHSRPSVHGITRPFPLSSGCRRRRRGADTSGPTTRPCDPSAVTRREIELARSRLEDVETLVISSSSIGNGVESVSMSSTALTAELSYPSSVRMNCASRSSASVIVSLTTVLTSHIRMERPQHAKFLVEVDRQMKLPSPS